MIVEYLFWEVFTTWFPKLLALRQVLSVKWFFLCVLCFFSYLQKKKRTPTLSPGDLNDLFSSSLVIFVAYASENIFRGNRCFILTQHCLLSFLRSVCQTTMSAVTEQKKKKKILWAICLRIFSEIFEEVILNKQTKHSPNLSLHSEWEKKKKGLAVKFQLVIRFGSWCMQSYLSGSFFRQYMLKPDLCYSFCFC